MADPIGILSPVVRRYRDEVQVGDPVITGSSEAKRDRVRERITLLLLGLLIGEVAGVAFMFMFAEMAQRTGQTFKWDDREDLVVIVLPSTITLGGTALGFYFGAQSESGDALGGTRSG